MAHPSITVLMTAYNAMPYIRETVASILGQTHRDFTLLILNNGSLDGTGEYLRELEAESGGPGKKPLLRIVHLGKNIGRTPVLNKGLEMVETDITAILDADDIALPERIARTLNFFVSHPDIDLVGSDITYIDGMGNIIGEAHYPTGHTELCRRLPLVNQFAHSACAFRTEKAREAGGYSNDFPYAQDMALWISMFRAGCRAASIPEPLARIRTHPGQTTRDIALMKLRARDNYNLSQAMLFIPCLGKESRQAARFRSAGALIKLGRIGEALTQIWQGIYEAPWLVPFNRLLWSRLLLEYKKRIKRWGQA